MIHWAGSCIVHDEFKADDLKTLMAKHPLAKVLVHPESPADVVALAHAVGSTSGILKAARKFEAKEFIVATDNGMMHKLRAQNPGKLFIEAPTGRNSTACRICAHCPWMAMNGLANMAQVLDTSANEIRIDPALIERARLPIDRMLEFTSALKAKAAGTVKYEAGAFVPGIGAV